ncbi:hypothetical protein Goshw_016713 [Gossypium schwendimanii]|uniref:Uncharacterized protein n=1 Tax=Gossypium schwendimanii TaxID=34291 RepID=A0A7J9L3K4_GOSSC|nr:hypothetical protein [Gossypium schwendimanii]
MECRMQHSIVRMFRSRKRLWGQGLHAMWIISYGRWSTTSVPKAS